MKRLLLLFLVRVTHAQNLRMQETISPYGRTGRYIGRSNFKRTSNLHELRIYSGLEDTNNSFNYAVAILGPKGFRFCTGSLITPTWVLTAAHCRGGRYVQYGDMSIRWTQTQNISKIHKIVIHPGIRDYYHPSGGVMEEHVENDLALFMIKTINFYVGTLSAVDYSSLIGCAITYAGFGRTSQDDYDVQAFLEDQNRLLQVGQGVVMKCNKEVLSMSNPMVICTAPKCSNIEQAVLASDSGGPLVYHGRIVGVMSFSMDDVPVIAVFMPVSPNLAWIQSVIHNSVTDG